MPTLRAMAREGAGVTIVPALVLPDPAPGLLAVPLDPARPRRLVAVRRADHAPLPLAAFLKAARFAAAPPVHA